MKSLKLRPLLYGGLLCVLCSCGNNNNQSEGAADQNDGQKTSGADVQNTSGSAGTGSSTADTIIKSNNNPEPGEGNYKAGTGEDNGSGKTGGG